MNFPRLSATLHPGNRFGEYMGVPMSRRRFQNPTPRLRRGRWEIVVREDVSQPDGAVKRRQKRLFLGRLAEIPTQKIARRIAEPILARLNATVGRPKRVARFEDFARLWSETVLQEMKPSSQSSFRSMLQVHLLPAFGNRLLYEFTPEMVQAFIASKRQPCHRMVHGQPSHQTVQGQSPHPTAPAVSPYGARPAHPLSPKTIWNILMALRAIWKTALEWRYASEDIFLGVRMRIPARPQARCFSTEEVRRILLAAEQPYHTFYWLAAETGMRAGELCALRWQDVDLEARIIRVAQSAWRGKIGPPKNSGSVRAFAISEALARTLSAIRIQELGVSGLGVPLPCTSTVQGLPSQHRVEGLLFHTRTGSPWDSNLIVKRKLVPLLGALGIPRAGLHAFRHFNATAMDRLRAPVAVMKSRLGHASLITTDRYTHALGEDDRAAAQGISRELVQ